MAAFASSYIKTEGSAVTRAADAASMTGTNFSSWYRDDEGTLFGDAILPVPALSGGQVRAFATLTDGTLNNYITFGRAATNTVRFRMTSGGVAQNGVTGQVIATVTSSNNKSAYAFKVNDLSCSANGVAPATDTDGATLPTIDRLLIGESPFTTDQSKFCSGTIRKIAYYPARLTNAQLQALTTV
jgi:hypothetical protein